MSIIDLMKAIREELHSYGRDITIDHKDRDAYIESVARFDEFKKLCKRIVELSRPI